MRRKWQRQVLLERAPDPDGELPKVGFARLEQSSGEMRVRDSSRAEVAITHARGRSN
jgi:hypothetical protein